MEVAHPQLLRGIGEKGPRLSGLLVNEVVQTAHGFLQLGRSQVAMLESPLVGLPLYVQVHPTVGVQPPAFALAFDLLGLRRSGQRQSDHYKQNPC